MLFCFALLLNRFGVVLVATIFVSSVQAQDLEPRAYANAPVGLNFLIAGYGYSEGGVATDPAVPLQDTNVQLHGAVFAYARSLAVWGKSGKFDVVLPYAWVSGTAKVAGQPRKREVGGENALEEEIRAFLRSVRDRSAPIVSGQDGLQALEVAEQIIGCLEVP